jgi:hypothetical protein
MPVLLVVVVVVEVVVVEEEDLEPAQVGRSHAAQHLWIA